ncbi:MAG: hypothetical protein BMS9Abin36_2118 [Gammaproteobacteria bacterium]|nr:MAG: hypothetical protein BMS9Abin36_2118 [Gammaproteobacteria bacterium]
MSYEVLARKWRPRVFDEMVGQQHVVQVLTHALDNDRLHHAFLFSGTRGVGKTTIARILAKSLNCEQGVSSKPCGKCATCQEVDSGRFLDLIEVDAASRTKVDDTRELLDNVQYAPTRGRYKVYLIDEVHMLSGHSFNALLKTLEEPPPHVKFLLATTDPQRLPVTVLSRCLQFALKRLSVEQIRDQLEKILKAEALEYDVPALALLAQCADGSMRDGLSLLDQALAFGGGTLSEKDVREMLGTIDQDVLDHILTALVEDQAAELVTVTKKIYDLGMDNVGVLDALLRVLHGIALVQADPGLSDSMELYRDHIAKYSDRLSREDTQLFYQIGLHGKRDLPMAPDPRIGLEMTLLRMLAFRPSTGEARAIASQVTSGIPSVADKTVAPEAPPKVSAKAEIVSTPEVAQVREPAVEQTTVSADADWSEVVTALTLSPLVREMASHTFLNDKTGSQISLVMDQAYDQLYSKAREAELIRAVKVFYGDRFKVKFKLGRPQGETPAARRTRETDSRQRAAEEAIARDPNIKALEEQFGGQVAPGSIRPRV